MTSRAPSPLLPAELRNPMLIAAAVIFLADRLTKFWVVEMLDLGSRLRIDVVPPYLNFVMAWNRGINFGIGAGPGWFLVAVALAISAALVWWVHRRRSMPGVVPMAWGAGIVIGGALGNAWDRVQYGAVADFLNMSCCGIDNPYAFNIADVAVFAGALIVALKS